LHPWSSVLWVYVWVELSGGVREPSFQSVCLHCGWMFSSAHALSFQVRGCEDCKEDKAKVSGESQTEGIKNEKTTLKDSLSL